jgi:predicted nucleic acid-binding protein
VRAVDTSVVVAAFATWHESHEPARAILAARPALPAPCAIEAFAVLTRLPAPHRAPATVVRDFLSAAFAAPYLALDGRSMRALVDELVLRGVSGGATYDAVIAATARTAGAALVTCDLRARSTYERLGVVVEYLAATPA